MPVLLPCSRAHGRGAAENAPARPQSAVFPPEPHKRPAPGVKITHRRENSLDNERQYPITNGIVDLGSLQQLPSSTETVGTTHHAVSGLRDNTAGAQADENEDEEAAAAMPLLPVRRRTAATATATAGAGVAAAAGAPLLQRQPGHHEARAW